MPAPPGTDEAHARPAGAEPENSCFDGRRSAPDATLADPAGEGLNWKFRPTGIQSARCVPLGVIGTHLQKRGRT